jgi:hypothetical protein
MEEISRTSKPNQGDLDRGLGNESAAPNPRPGELGHLVPEPQQLGGQLLGRGLDKPFVVQRGSRPPQPAHPHAHGASCQLSAPPRWASIPPQRARERAREL